MNTACILKFGHYALPHGKIIIVYATPGKDSLVAYPSHYNNLLVQAIPWYGMYHEYT
jgi:hypothetical protein